MDFTACQLVLFYLSFSRERSSLNLSSRVLVSFSIFFLCLLHPSPPVIGVCSLCPCLWGKKGFASCGRLLAVCITWPTVLLGRQRFFIKILQGVEAMG